MKPGWKIESLGELCDFQRGLTYAKSDEADVSNNIVLRATNIDLTTNLLDFAELKYINDKVVVPASKKVKKDSLMICTASGSKSHLGKVAYIDDDYGYAFGGFMGMITPKNGLVPKYLFHLMTSDAYKDFIGELSDGANINNLKFDDLKKFQVPHPKPDEQQRIVGILDEAFEGIATAKANAEKNLQNARALFESYLQFVFTQGGKGWEEKTLGDVCETTQGVQIPKNLHSKSPGKNLRRYLYISDFEHDENLKYVEDIYPTKRVTENDLIVVNTGATAGKIFRGIDGVLSNNLFKVTLNPGVDGDFLYYFVTSSLFKEHQKKIVKGTANPHMGHENFKSTPVNIPPLDVQLDTVAKLDGLSEETKRLTSIYDRKLAALGTLKKSMLHQAFSGKL